MNEAGIVTQFRGIIAENPLTITFGAQNVIGSKANKTVAEKQVDAGKNTSYRFSVWTIKADWTTKPQKREKLTIAGTNYRILDTLEYYLGVLRFDLGAEYETGKD